MRRIAPFLLLLFFPYMAFSQSNVNRLPDCRIPFTFTTAGTGGTITAPGSTAGFRNLNDATSCTIWTLTYQVTGLSGVSIQFDQAPDSNNAPGSWSVWSNLVSGTLPLTATTYSQITGFGYAPWVRVTVNSVMGTGQVTGSLLGWRSGTGDASLPASGPVVVSKADGVVLSYEPLVKGGTAAMSGTTSTQVIAAVGSQNIYVTSCSVNNTHASVDTLVDLQDGNAGTVIWTFVAAHGYGGESHSFSPYPLKVPTQGNGLFAVDETTGASVKVFCNGFSSTNSY